MGRFNGHTRKALLAAAVAAFALPAFGAASAQIGGFDTELPKPGKKKERVKKQDIVYVNQQPGHDGPRSLGDAMKLVKDNGEIVIHPGRYDLDPVTLSKNVTIRGLHDEQGTPPTLMARRGCVSLRSDKVSARITNLTFHSVGQGDCISVKAGRLHMVKTDVLGRHASRLNLADADSHINTNGSFSVFDATNVRSALVSITGGEVTIEKSKIRGGETGVFVDPGAMGDIYHHVELEDTLVSDMEKAGVVLIGAADAELHRNRILQNRLGGVVFSGSGHARLSDNIISLNGHNGLYVQAANDAVSIERNTIDKNGGDGIFIGSGRAVLVSNLIQDNSSGCNVRTRQVDEHVNIRIYEDHRGMSGYAPGDGCQERQAKGRSRGRGRG